MSFSRHNSIDVGSQIQQLKRSLGFGSDCLREVGFHRDEALLPFLPTAHPQYRLLQEYFALPEKFLFVDITRLDTVPLDTSSFEILLPLRTLPNEHRLISTESFALQLYAGCQPLP